MPAYLNQPVIISVIVVDGFADFVRIAGNNNYLLAIFEYNVLFENIGAEDRHATEGRFDASAGGKPVESSRATNKWHVRRQDQIHTCMKLWEKICLSRAVKMN